MSKYLSHKIQSVTLLQILRRVLATGLMLTTLLAPCQATDHNVEVQYEPEQRKWYATLMGTRVEVEPDPESVHFEVFMSEDLNTLPLSKVLSVKERVYREIEAFRYGKSEKLIESLQMDPEEYYTQWDLKFERNKRDHFTRAIVRGYIEINGQQHFLDDLVWQKDSLHSVLKDLEKPETSQYPDIFYRHYDQTTGVQLGGMLKTLYWDVTPEDQYKDWQEEIPPCMLQGYRIRIHVPIPETHESFMGYCEHLILKETFDDRATQILPPGDYEAVDGDRIPSPYIYCNEDKQLFVTHCYEEIWRGAGHNERTTSEFKIHRIMRTTEVLNIVDGVKFPAQLSKGVYQRVGARTYGDNQGDIWQRIDSDQEEKCTMLYPRENGYWIQDDANRCPNLQTLKQKMYFQIHALSWKFCAEHSFVQLLKHVKMASHLNSLIVHSCKIDCSGAQALTSLTNLTFLDLSGNNMSYQSVQALTTLTNLTTLYLMNNNIRNTGNLRQTFTNLTNLTDLKW